MFHFGICIRLIFGNSKNSLCSLLKQFRISPKISSTDTHYSHNGRSNGEYGKNLKLNSVFSIEISFFEEVFFLPFFASFRESDSYLEYIPLGVDTHWDKGSTGFFDFLSDSQYLLL